MPNSSMGRSSSEGSRRASAGRIGGNSENSSHLDLAVDNHHSIAVQGLEFRQIIDCLLANESSVEIQHGKQVEEQRSWSNQALQRSAFYFAEAQRLGHMGGWVFDPATGFDYWSDELFRIHGLDPDAEPPSSEQYLALVHPHDRKLMATSIKRMVLDVAGFDITKRIVRPNGEVRYVRCVANPLVDDATAKRMGIAIDVTEHELLTQELRQREVSLQRSEAALRRSEKELREVIDAIPTIAWSALPDGSNTYVNKGFVEYSGLSPEQAAGSGWQAAAHPDDLQMSKWATYLATSEPFEHEMRFRRADGQYRWHLCRGVPLRDVDGKILKWYGILFDIDELKKTGSALQEREHQLLGIIETIPSMLWSVSPTGETTYLSQRVLEYCGAPSEELINRGWERFIHPDDREETTKAFDRAISSGESYSAIHRLRRADGEYRWHHSMGEPLRDPHGKIIQWYGLATDIDERKRAEDHLRDMRIKLTSASRIATLAELSASIAHELNQPLMSVLANAQAGKRWLAANPPNLLETNASIERIIRDARAADEVMLHIRALFKQEPFEKKQVSIRDVLSEAVRFLHGDPRKHNASIDWQLDDNLPTVSVDLTQIQQVFINLISNAMEALEGSQISPRILVRASTTDQNQMLIQLIDNGPGVADQERIFDAFVTTKKNGMGVGLAVSRSIVEAHGGQLWAQNNPSGGATFSVALPLSSGQLNSSSSRGQTDSH
jgi:PAS domain S-box-containing protein